MDSHFATIFEKDAFTDVLGQTRTKQQLKSALLMRRHVVIVGPPGIGKTTIAKNVAKLLPEIDGKKGSERFVRIQGSPDLTVEDILGDIDPVKALKFGPTSMEAFTPGKIFKADQGVLFFDELNRAPEKLQNSLLQVLQEGYATLGNYTVEFPTNFIFIGTMNPEESTATEKLSDVFMDRFDVIHMGYPEQAVIEQQIVNEEGEKIDSITFPEKLLAGAITFIRRLRDHKDIMKKPSVRASLGLYERAQANAFLAKRDTVTAQDINDVLISVLSHRMELKPSVKYLQSVEEFIEQEHKKFAAEHDEFEDGGDYL